MLLPNTGLTVLENENLAAFTGALPLFHSVKMCQIFYVWEKNFDYSIKCTCVHGSIQLGRTDFARVELFSHLILSLLCFSCCVLLYLQYVNFEN